MLIPPLERIHPTQTHWIYRGTINQHIARYHHAAKEVSGKSVLDIACGYGYGSEILAKAGAQSVIGIDISETAINSARAEYSQPNLSFKVGNATNIQIPDQSIDYVVSFETIEHLPKNLVDTYLRELHRVLTPGGTILISSPDIRGFSLNKISSNHFHEQEFTRTQFIQLISQQFTIQQIYIQEPTPKLLLDLMGLFAQGTLSHPIQKLWRAIRTFFFCSGQLQASQNETNMIPMMLVVKGIRP